MRHPEDPPFEIDAVDGPLGRVVSVRGPLDIATYPALEKALEDANQSQAERILLDLEELSFVDARGLSLFVRAVYRSTANGDRLRLTRGSGHVARIFRMTRLAAQLPFADEPVGTRATSP